MIVVISILITLLFGYLLGSVSSAILICRLLKLPDPRLQGSKNPGATNVMRLGGKKAGVLTFLGDSLKGVIVILLIRLVTDEAWIIAAGALGAFLGHLYPLYFGFKGGKGVATFVGIIALLQPISALVFAGVWLVLTFGIGYVSVASMFGAIASVIYTMMAAMNETVGHDTGHDTRIYALLFFCMTVAMVSRHRQNIRQLLAGTENKIRLRQKLAKSSSKKQNTYFTDNE